MPQPIATASHPAARRRMSSSAARESLPSSVGNGWGMVSSDFTAATCQMSDGTPRNTSPQPLRTAAREQNTGAPV